MHRWICHLPIRHRSRRYVGSRVRCSSTPPARHRSRDCNRKSTVDCQSIPATTRSPHRRTNDVSTLVTMLSNEHPAAAIVRWAHAHPTTLLVMASHGDGASNGLLGGTVMDVVRHTLTPVAVIPAHASNERVE